MGSFVISWVYQGNRVLPWCVCIGLDRARNCKIPLHMIVRGGHGSHDGLVSTLRKCYPDRKQTPTVQDYVFVVQFKFLRFLNTTELLCVPPQQASGYGMGQKLSSDASRRPMSSFLARHSHLLD